jgi:hypothetical protein
LIRIPVVNNIIPGRFIAVTSLCVAILVGLIADRGHRFATGFSAQFAEGDHEGARADSPRPPWLRRLAPATGGIAVVVAILPIAAGLWRNVPLTVVPVTIPRWYAAVAPRLPPGQVLLSYPLPFSLQQSAMDWQAIDRMHYSMAGGGGPEGALSRAGNAEPGMALLSSSSTSFDAPAAPSAHDLRAVRHALALWGVTMVVIPDDTDLPIYEQLNNAPYAIGLITAATGQRPRHQADAWVWDHVRSSPGALTVSPDVFKVCEARASPHRGVHPSVSDSLFTSITPRT